MSPQIKQLISNKVPVLRLVADSEKLVVASASKVKVFSLSDGLCLKKFAAPLYPCQGLSLLGATRILASDGTESITVYDIPSSKDSSKSGANVISTLVAEGSATLGRVEGGKSGDVVALTSDGKTVFRWTEVSNLKVGEAKEATNSFNVEGGQGVFILKTAINLHQCLDFE